MPCVHRYHVCWRRCTHPMPHLLTRAGRWRMTAGKWLRARRLTFLAACVRARCWYERMQSCKGSTVGAACCYIVELAERLHALRNLQTCTTIWSSSATHAVDVLVTSPRHLGPPSPNVISTPTRVRLQTQANERASLASAGSMMTLRRDGRYEQPTFACPQSVMPEANRSILALDTCIGDMRRPRRQA